MKKYLVLVTITIFALTLNVNAQGYNFSQDLQVGSAGPDVVALQEWLITNSFNIPAISSGLANKGFFGSQTKLALINYQKSIGFPSFGFFGPMTRGKLNERPSTDSRAPVINGIDAPTSLAIGQTGTWTVRATDPQNGTLSYSVDWGDTMAYAAVACPLGYSCDPINPPAVSVQQGSTFTHAYWSKTPNVYNVRFTVRNNLGLTAQTSTTVQVGPNSASPITITSPNGGEIWQANSTHQISWSVTGLANVNSPLNIYLDKVNINCIAMIGANCNVTYVLDRNILASTIYNWIVATDVNNVAIPAGDYKVRICVAGSTTNCNSSDASFTITSKDYSQSALIYSVTTDKTMYRQNESITIHLQAYNPTDSAITLGFNSGCESKYIIDSFDSMTGMMCTANMPNETINPRSTKSWDMIHNPSRYAVPIGVHTIQAGLVGSSQLQTSTQITLIN